MCGIYKITNNINGKVYIGQSICIERRWRNHKNYFGSGNEDYPLYRAFSKYGIENFSFEVVEECETDLLNEREIYWISFYRSNQRDYGYNQTAGGSFSTPIKLTFEEAEEIINLLKDSSLSQEEIAEQFNISQRTVSGICLGETWRKNRESYPIRKKHIPRGENKENYCIDCGMKISSNAIRCSSCQGKISRKAERPSRDELKSLIRHFPFTKIAEKFEVSDNAIRKWCDSYNLPRKAKDIKSFSDAEWIKV